MASEIDLCCLFCTQTIYLHQSIANRHFGVVRSVVLNCEKVWGVLDQAQLTGAGDGFGTPLYLQFFKNPAVVPLDRIKGEEKSLADFLI